MSEKCIHKNCDKEIFRRNYCAMHLYRLKAGIDMDLPVNYRKQPKICVTASCREKPIARSLCRAHYEQVRVNGYITSKYISKNGCKQKHTLYATWQNMLARCYRKGNDAYHNYGGRGIKVCKRWRNDMHTGFDNFLKDMGERPEGLTLDRIDNDGNYEPSNCRWATRTEQMLNTRRTKASSKEKYGY